jgi:hypothetical protein
MLCLRTHIWWGFTCSSTIVDMLCIWIEKTLPYYISFNWFMTSELYNFMVHCFKLSAITSMAFKDLSFILEKICMLTHLDYMSKSFGIKRKEIYYAVSYEVHRRYRLHLEKKVLYTWSWTSCWWVTVLIFHCQQKIMKIFGETPQLLAVAAGHGKLSLSS